MCQPFGGRSHEPRPPSGFDDYRFFGVWDNALAAAALSAGLLFGSCRTLPAAVAAFGPVCRVFFPVTVEPLLLSTSWHNSASEGKLAVLQPRQCDLIALFRRRPPPASGGRCRPRRSHLTSRPDLRTTCRRPGAFSGSWACTSTRASQEPPHGRRWATRLATFRRPDGRHPATEGQKHWWRRGESNP